MAKIFNYMMYFNTRNIASNQLFSYSHVILDAVKTWYKTREKRRLQPEAELLNAADIKQENDTKYKIIFTNAMIQYIKHKVRYLQ